MKQVVLQCLTTAIASLQTSGHIPTDLALDIQLENAKSPEHGDFSSNIAFLLAKPCRLAPKIIAEQILAQFPSHPAIDKVEVAGAGFINFFIKKQALVKIVDHLLKYPEEVGRVAFGKKQKVLLEFVSSNPTGPLHVGHGRLAAFGASLANILKAADFKVSTEYYVNDAGRQMDILAASVFLRFLSCAGEDIVFPVNAYKGDYVLSLAQSLWQETPNKERFVIAWRDLREGLPLDECEGGDKEIYIDALIQRSKALITEEGFAFFHHAALRFVLADIQSDLSDFGVTFDDWFSEQSLFDKEAIAQSIDALKQKGDTYEQNGALWFKARDFGDEKDRVLIRENGQPTYFASDVAYHWYKYHRGFERVINVFGADHHGYVARIKAAVTALGHDAKALDVILVQFATLYRGEERVQMSTRSGSFVTLRELREEVGNDAARFFYVLRKPDQHMEFDLELAKSQSQDNPVYYIQYAHARICSVMRQLTQRDLTWDEERGLRALETLKLAQEENLVLLLNRYVEVIQAAAKYAEPHLLAYYLRDLANGLHTYYNAVTLLCDDESLRDARLCLLKAVSIVLKNGLQLLGVSAPERM